MYHYVYEITNIISGRKYIGCRSCAVDPVEDIGYMGSSKYLKEDIDNIGLDKFTKEILSTFGSRSEAIAEEIRLHNHFDVAVNELYYNRSKQTSTKFSFSRQGVSNEALYGKEKADLIKQKFLDSRIYKKGEGHPFYGKKHSCETKKKISTANIGNKSRLGYKNSEESKKKLSSFRKNAHVSKNDYIVTDPNGTKYIVEKIGIRHWVHEKFNISIPSAFKSSIKTGKPVQKGKWKGWRVDIIG